MDASTNSGASPRFREVVSLAAGLSLLIAAVILWVAHRGYTLYYGDAQAHLSNISRAIIDSRTPGYEQIGTVWLPFLHVICLPFVGNNFLWSTGLAGSIPVGICFVIAGTFFYLTARAVYCCWQSAAVVVACFAFNINVLYLSSIPMTETVFLAGFAVLLFCGARYQKANNRRYIAGAVFASMVMSLTRYDGWFLIPFAAIWFAMSARRRRTFVFVAFAAVASCAPLYWAAHNWFETGNALDFFNGPYSAKAIQGGRPYPGYHDWMLAIVYYLKAGQLCTGWPLLLLGVIGLIVAWRTKRFAVCGMLCLTPIFYTWSIHSSGNPIFVPQLYPHGYYNTRYGIALVALAAFAAGAIADALPAKKNLLAWCLPAVAALPWMLHPVSICWRESDVNSVARRAWTFQTAAFLQTHYVAGTGVLTDFGDLTGIYCHDEIPLRETLHLGNGAAWMVASRRPELDPQAWAIAQEGSELATALNSDKTRTYQLTYEIRVPKAPVIQIYARSVRQVIP